MDSNILGDKRTLVEHFNKIKQACPSAHHPHPVLHD